MISLSLVEGLRICVLCIVTAIAYGVLHDLLSVALCVEYLRDHHPSIGTTVPILLALGWGVLATWWVGLFGGLVLATVCRVGNFPPLTWRDVARPLWLGSATALGMALIVWLREFYRRQFVHQGSTEETSRLAATQAMHAASYFLALVLIVWLAVSLLRKRAALTTSPPSSASAP
ncbi:MAG: hypothetical protein JSS66_18560 [Armatimonadetes bacterium]|nr:hypothetical protein [Armatimonadota bacterium]